MHELVENASEMLVGLGTVEIEASQVRPRAPEFRLSRLLIDGRI